MIFKSTAIPLACAVSFLILGCGTTEITKTVDDMYTVAAQYGSANGSWDRASKEANEKALVFCEGKRQSLVLVNERRDGIWGVSPQRAEVKFKCVSADNVSMKSDRQSKLEAQLGELKILHQKGLLTRQQYDAQVEKAMAISQ